MVEFRYRWWQLLLILVAGGLVLDLIWLLIRNVEVSIK
jgi:dolichyl-phosphate-mannose--protein O-mannosyl transferase